MWTEGFMVPSVLALLVMILLVYGITVNAPFYALSLLMIYLNVYQRRLMGEQKKVAQRDAELTESRIAVMLSQIQPHFLYNALCVIQGLCTKKLRMRS